MSELKKMAYEYRVAAAKLAMSIERHKEAGDLPKEEMNRLSRALREVREVGHLLSSYRNLSGLCPGVRGLPAQRMGRLGNLCYCRVEWGYCPPLPVNYRLCR